MCVEAAYLNVLLPHIFRLNFYLVDLVRFCAVNFFAASHEEISFGFSTVSAAPPGVSVENLKFAVSEING